MKKSESNGKQSATTGKPAPAMPETASRLQDFAAPAASNPRSQNVISSGTVIEGNISADGDLRVEGIVRGDVTTRNTLTVAPGCVIEGNLLALNAEVAGEVHGTVEATDLLTIKSTGMIDGDVITRNLNVEAGSAFSGRFQVGPAKEIERPAWSGDALSVTATV